MRLVFALLLISLLLPINFVSITDAQYFGGDSTGRYRLMTFNNPSKRLIFGWDYKWGEAKDNIVYYDTIDHGTDVDKYRFSKKASVNLSYKGMNNAFVVLDKLKANTKYFLVVGNTHGVSRRLWFQTLPNSKFARLSLIAGGDSRNNREVRRNANLMVSKLKPHAVLFGGDMTKSGTSSQWQKWFDDWQMTIPVNGRLTPLIVARGNHEEDNEMLEKLFHAPKNIYYGVNLGGDLLKGIVLNSEISVYGNQTTWLNRELQKTKTQWKVALYHRPIRPHSIWKREGDKKYRAWAPLFYAHGVDLVVESDSHTVKRTWPLRPSFAEGSDEGFIRDDKQGTVYIGEGCWGAPIRRDSDKKDWTRDSGSFNQFNWIFVDRSKIEVRTVKVDNASEVEEIRTDLFSAPKGLKIWHPKNGELIEINNPEVKSLKGEFLNFDTTVRLGVSESHSFQVSAFDERGADLAGVRLYANDKIVGTRFYPPYNFHHQFNEEGIYSIRAEILADDGLRKEIFGGHVFVGDVKGQVSVRISKGRDDVEETKSGRMLLHTNGLEMVDVFPWFRKQRTIGLRFENIPLPKGAIITKAHINFTSKGNNKRETALYIKGLRPYHAGPFRDRRENLTARHLTENWTSWYPKKWYKGDVKRSPDLSDVVTEMIEDPSWEYNGDLGFSINGMGKRKAYSFDKSPANAPELVIRFE